MKSFLFSLLFLGLIITAASQRTFACSCAIDDPDVSLEQQVKESFNRAFAVFSAKVEKITYQKSLETKIIKLRVYNSWKGKPAKTLIMKTAYDSAMCGFNFEKGKTYLIYGYGKDFQNLTTNICTRTSVISLSKDVKILDKMKKGN